MAISKFEAILSLTPNAEFQCEDDVITEWLSDDITQPTDAEITTEQTRLQTEYDNNAYQRNRAAEYPSIPDQLDDIYHNGIDAWKATIKVTKDKYPKPS
tara:strand:- start:215 stop:511 length:297 start_codon:yes stop_codon:yes gene_type:complete